MQITFLFRAKYQKYLFIILLNLETAYFRGNNLMRIKSDVKKKEKKRQEKSGWQGVDDEA